jgi:hypothetical protein
MAWILDLPVTGKYWAWRPKLASLGGITCCLPACASWGYRMVSMHSCQLLILVSSFIQTPQVEPRGHLIALIQWTLQFVHRSCQVKGLHADSKGVGFRKSPLLTGTKTMKGFQYNAKAHHWVQRKTSHKNETYAISGQFVILPNQGGTPMLQSDRPNHKYIIKELMCSPT